MGIALGVCTARAETSAAAPARSLPTGGHANNAFIPAWDANSDGNVSRGEYEALRKVRFAKTDENGNGELDQEEYVIEYAMRLDRDIATERQASITQTDARFRALDRNEDEAISREEYDASGERMFAQLDRDKDERISKKDSPAVATDTNGNADGRRADQSRGKRSRSVIRMPTTHRPEGFLEIYDDDGDDVVTRAQFEVQRSRTFTATDANGDGALDIREYEREFLDRLDRRIALTRQAQLKQAQVRFKSIDGDKSGTISGEEYAAMSARMFERMDTNHDDIVSRDDPAPTRDARSERTAARQSDRP